MSMETEMSGAAGVGGLGLGVGEVSPATNHHPPATSHQPPTTEKTELGLEVAVKEPAWRQHTAANFKANDPESYAMVCHLIRTGMTNQSELRRLVEESRKERGLEGSVSRNTIQALMMAEFTEAELVDIGKRAARIGEMIGLDKTTELLDKAAAAKDVGGVAMATKLLHDIAQSLNDKPAQVFEHRAKVTLADVERLRLEARERAAVPVVEVESVTIPADA